MRSHSNVVFFTLAILLSSATATNVFASEAKRVVPNVNIVGEREKVRTPDAIEPVNRSIYSFNDAVDNVTLEPIARGYDAAVPNWGKERVGSFVGNLSEPVSFLNNALQGDADDAVDSFWRFVVNSTLGIGGLFDVAGEFGIQKNPEDFDQTLAVWGVESGSYVMLPILGPTTVRGIVGKAGDIAANPFSFVGTYPQVAWRATDAVNTRYELLPVTDEIENNSFDPYATIRSAYIQSREAEIKK